MSNKDVECKTGAYFGDLDKSYYIKSIQILEGHWKKCIVLEEKYVDE